MKAYVRFINEVKLPRMVDVRQTFERPVINDIPVAVAEQLARAEISTAIRPGMSVAITGGSRGIANIPVILREVVRFCLERGAKPFIFPAMGSHGGATAEGQTAILNAYGITEGFCGCPIRATMDVRQIASLDNGFPVMIDRYAAEADAIIAVNRVKPHTAFSGKYESGILKMLTIGTGKQVGAAVCHDTGFGYMHDLIPTIGSAIMRYSNFAFGLAIVENAYDETCRLQAMLPGEVMDMEAKLLTEAKRLMGKILFDSADVLIVDEIGKNISGEGADPNVTGRFPTPYASGGINAQVAVALALTPETHGCAYGMGMFDIISGRLHDELDLVSGYANAMTSLLLSQPKMPMFFDRDEDAIAAAIQACCGIDRSMPRIVRIRNTAHLGHIQISETMLDEVGKNPDIEILGEPKPLLFNEMGNLELLSI